MEVRLEPKYGLLTLAWLATIAWLSSRPDLGTSESSPLVARVSNLMHVPLFAGLAYCLLKTLPAGGQTSWPRSGIVFLVATGFAALDEWHQSLVPGRFASVSDFLLDIIGVVAVILILHFRSLREANP